MKKDKTPKPVFVLSITENSITAAKINTEKALRKSVTLVKEELASDADENAIAQKLNALLARLEYQQEPVILSLSRNQATCRYVNIPSDFDTEIEHMVVLQAWQHLPYPPEDLITGHQRIQTNQEGYTQTNVIILHKAVVERFIRIFHEAGIQDFIVALSSYGVSWLYGFLVPQNGKTILCADINSHQAELVVISDKKMVFSRSFKFMKEQTGWQDLFAEEIKKTLEAYAKEVSLNQPEKILLLGQGPAQEALSYSLKENFVLPVEILPYSDKMDVISLDGNFSMGISFGGIVGLGLQEIPLSLNLLPAELKAATKRFAFRKELVHAGILMAAALLMWGLGTVKDLENKERYLQLLKAKQKTVTDEAQPLEYADRRFKILENLSQKEFSGLDMLSELYQITPPQISLLSLGYEAGPRIILKGQAPTLDNVFDFASLLKNSSGFKDLQIEVKYATQRKLQTSQAADFEIVCASRTFHAQTAQ
ncbi:MAG: pilus assembly protein PilM [Candidatus Omnitrophica bacterium]|nr:pilus assembly protein PilM [Candidatus Omnitrophota bacterium]